MIGVALLLGVGSLGLGMASLGGLMVVAVGRAGMRAFVVATSLGGLSLGLLALARWVAGQ